MHPKSLLLLLLLLLLFKAVCTDAQWAGCFGYTDEILSQSFNTHNLHLVLHAPQHKPTVTVLFCNVTNLFLQALDGWCITAGYVGLVRGVLPLTTAAASGSSSSRTGSPADPTATGVRANLTLDEVLITVAPKPLNTSGSEAEAAAAAGGAATAGASNTSSTTTQLLQQQLGDDAEGSGLLGQVGVLDGISLIAGALEAQLQRLSLAATNITVRLEVPRAAATASVSQHTAAAAPRAAAGVAAAVGAELILHVEALHFYDATAQQQQQQHSAAQPAAAAAAGQQGTVPAAAELVKCVSVTGLTLELLDLQEEEEQAECEQGSGLAASQLLDPASFVSSSSTTFQQQQQQSPRQQSPRQQSSHVRWSQQHGARGSCSSSSSRYMTRSSMLRSSWMAEQTAAAAVAEQADSWQQQQQCLDGLLLGGSGSSAGLDFKVELRLALPAAAAAAAGGPASGSASTAAAAAAAAAAAGPRITADINSSPVSIVLQPWQLPLLELLSTAAAAAAAAAGAAGAAAAGPARRQQGSPTPQQQQQQQQEWGTRSLVEDLFFPRCEGLVASYLSFCGPNSSNVTGLSSSRAWQQQQQQQQQEAFGGANLLGSGLLGDVGSGLYNSVTTGDNFSDGLHSEMYSSMYNSSSSVRVGSVYHDARSVFVGNSSSSGLLGQSVHNYNISGSGGSSLPILQQLPQAPNPWASQQQQQPLQQQQQQQRVAPAAAAVWSVRGCIAAVTVALHHDVPACAAAAAASISSPQRQRHQQQQQQQQDQQPPRFVIQCSGLVASLDLAGKGRHMTLKCYCLEASEHLPVAWGLADRQLARLNPGVLGAVPKAVPPVQGTTARFAHQVGEDVFEVC
jgi:hypothetical protein